MQKIRNQNDISREGQTFGGKKKGKGKKSASFDHVLTNRVVLQESVLELVAVLQVCATVLGGRQVEIRLSSPSCKLQRIRDGNVVRLGLRPNRYSKARG